MNFELLLSAMCLLLCASIGYNAAVAESPHPRVTLTALFGTVGALFAVLWFVLLCAHQPALPFNILTLVFLLLTISAMLAHEEAERPMRSWRAWGLSLLLFVISVSYITLHLWRYR